MARLAGITWYVSIIGVVLCHLRVTVFQLKCSASPDIHLTCLQIVVLNKTDMIPEDTRAATIEKTKSRLLKTFQATKYAAMHDDIIYVHVAMNELHK